MTLSRADRARLADLRDQAELAELEIRTMDSRGWTTVDSSRLTVGQILVIADLIDAFQVIRNFKPTDESEREFGDTYASPSYGAELRSSSPFVNGYGSGVESRYSDEADQSEAAKEEVLKRFVNLLTGNIPDDQEIATVNGPVRYGDIPRDENGAPLTSWVDENCTCEKHTRERVAKANQEAASATENYDPFAYRPGNYL